MPSFLAASDPPLTEEGFFERYGLDRVAWMHAVAPVEAEGQHFDPAHTAGPHAPGPHEARRIVSDAWRIEREALPDSRYATERFVIATPGGTLSTVLQSDAHTTWVAERLVKRKSDIDIIAAHAPRVRCDVDAVNRRAGELGETGILRGMVHPFEIYGQPGCWQDAAVLYGIEDLIFAVYDDPAWVEAFLGVLLERKLRYVASLRGARFDLIELGGGDASTTVISPAIFSEFVAPCDSRLIACAHASGQRVVYHTCGGMMPILEDIAAMGADAMETFTPHAMGGDTDLAEARRRIGGRVCMIGGFDQNRFFRDATPQETRAAVRRCFEEAGLDGGYILAPSDHFFEAKDELMQAFSDEARRCAYGQKR